MDLETRGSGLLGLRFGSFFRFFHDWLMIASAALEFHIHGFTACCIFDVGLLLVLPSCAQGRITYRQLHRVRGQPRNALQVQLTLTPHILAAPLPRWIAFDHLAHKQAGCKSHLERGCSVSRLRPSFSRNFPNRLCLRSEAQ